MFIESAWSSHSSAKSEMPGISLFAEMMRGNRVTIDISPLCGDEQFPSFGEPIQGLLRQSSNDRIASNSCTKRQVGLLDDQQSALLNLHLIIRKQIVSEPGAVAMGSSEVFTVSLIPSLPLRVLTPFCCALDASIQKRGTKVNHAA